MSLYESLDLFVGAGLLASVPAVGCAVAPEAVRRAGGLSAFLRSRGEADAVGVLLDQLARDIWLGQETRGVPHTLAEHHAEALAHLMAECPPDAGLIATALADGGGAGPGDAARTIADDLLQRSSAAGLVAGAHLRADVAQHLVEDFYRHLLADVRLLPALVPQITAYLAATGAETSRSVAVTGAVSTGALVPQAGPVPPIAAEARRQPRGVIALTGETREPPATVGAGRRPSVRPLSERARAVIADRTGEAGAIASIRHRHRLSDGALDRFLAILDAQAVPAGQRMERLEEMATWLESARRALSQARPETTDADASKSAAAEALTAGDFETAAELLIEARRAIREARREAERRLSAEIGAIRAASRADAAFAVELAHVALARLDPAGASVLFAEAADLLPHEEAAGRRVCLVSAAEAADTAARLGGSEGDHHRAVAAWERVRAAGDEAGDTTGGEGVRDIEHQLGDLIGLADASARLGTTFGAAAPLKAAIRLYREAQSLLPRSDGAVRSRLIDLRLGETLAVLGRRQDEPEDLKQGALQEAMLRLERAVGGLAGEAHAADKLAAQIALGETLVALAGRAGDAGWAGTLLEDAAACLVQAAAQVSQQERPREWAIVQLRLGSVLSGLAARHGDRRQGVAAAVALVPALETLESLGETDLAAEARAALTAFRDRWDALAEPSARTG